MSSLIDIVIRNRSVSIIGMAKNSGKTVCLNYLLSELEEKKLKLAVTSVGIDGEKTDLVTNTEKPEITLAAGTIFETSEYHYRQRLLTSEILSVSESATSLGRLVTARVVLPGKIILSGSSTSTGVRKFLDRMSGYDVDISIVDGALSRKSHASPLITDGLILAVGTSLAPDLNTIIKKTTELKELMQIPEYSISYSSELMKLENGIFALTDEKYVDLEIPSSLLTDIYRDKLFIYGTKLYISGILTDIMLNFLRTQSEIKDIVIVVKDFTKIFVTPMSLRLFQSKGGKLFVVKRPNLLAVTVNPVAPSGFKIASDILKDAMQKVFNAPVFDVMKDE